MRGCAAAAAHPACRRSASRVPPQRIPRAGASLPVHRRQRPRIADMSITRDEVAHLARLSRLALSDEELDHLAPQLDQIISAVAQVQEVAAEGIPPTSHATGLTNVFRDDEPAPCLTPDEALSQAPAVEQRRFKVPRILAEEP
jgi:aspartyl-tRNA(Asn)/glutamyl-tRNA(Gln) amidotransferase subunit C